MAPRGHPDYQSFANTQSPNIFPAFTQTLVPGTYSTAVIPVGNWSSLACIVTPSAGACKVSVAHYADLAGTQVIGSDNWPVSLLSSLHVRTPLRGPYVQIVIQVTGAVTMTAVTWASFQSAPASRITFPVGYQSVFANAVALAASSFQNFYFPRICAGWAFVEFVPHDAAGKLQVYFQVLTELLVFRGTLFNSGSPLAVLNQQLLIPDDFIQIQVANIDGAAPHTFDLSVVVPPQGD